MTTTLDHQPEALADQYEAAKERGHRLRTECHTSQQMAYLLYFLVEVLAEDVAFGAAVDKYLDDTKPQPHLYPVCAECGEHGGHTLTCAVRPYSLGDDWIPCVREVTVGSQPDMIRNPAGRLEHLAQVTA